MIQVHVTNELAISGLSTEQTRALQARTTYKNPLFLAARRSGRYTGATAKNPEGIPETLRVWREDDLPDGSLLILPRGLLSEVEDRLAPELLDHRVAPYMRPIEMAGISLRDYQSKAIETIEEMEQGVIQAPTGSGKTVIGLGLIAALETPALFIVHTRVLLDQTCESMRRMLGITPGVIGDGRFAVNDVTVAMVQTLQRMDDRSIRDLSKRFGLVILDEAHHCPAASFRQVMASFHAKYRVGLTATPRRKDGMEPLLYDSIGPIVYRVDPGMLIEKGSIVPAEVIRVQTGWMPRPKKAGDDGIPKQRIGEAQKKRILKNGGKVRDTVDYTALLALLVADAERNQLIVDRINALHEERSLVLTERVEHAKSLAQVLTSRGLLARHLTGDVPQSQRQDTLARLKAGTLPILVSTPQLVGEGFDLPTIDTVFLVAPNGNPTKTTQILGRVLRPAKGKSRGRIVDFRDDGIPQLRSQGSTRDRVYRTFERSGSLPLGGIA